MPKIGPISLPAPFCQAGLAGYSDRAMRLVARKHGCPYAVTEALLDVILLNGGEGLRRSIDISDEDHPVAGQIMGSEAQSMASAAVILHQAGYDVIDLNFACPVKKIKNKARGGHMLRDVERGHSILRAVRERLPTATLTVSLRQSFDGDEAADELIQLLDEAWRLGFAAARVHARSVEQRYLGPANWQTLKLLKQHYPSQTLLGSGDVFTAADAARMKRETGVDAVWIARGAIGNPWIFRDAAKLLEDPFTQLSPPTVPDQRAALQEHFDEAMKLHGEQLAGRRMRKQGIKYARFHPQAAEVKSDFIAVSSLADWRRTLDKWYSADIPGVWPADDAADEVNDQACNIA